MKPGDLVSWPREDGGGDAFGHVVGVRGGKVKVEFGSGNKLTRKDLPVEMVRVREPRG